MTPVLSTAASGLRAAALRAETAATNIVNVNTPGYQAGRVAQTTLSAGNGGVSAATAVTAQVLGAGEADLTRGIVDLIEAEASYKASARVLRTAEELARETLDIRA